MSYRIRSVPLLLFVLSTTPVAAQQVARVAHSAATPTRPPEDRSSASASPGVAEARVPRIITSAHREVEAVFAERAPVIDGRDDDAVWRSADVIEGFRQWQPAEDGEPSQRTTARIAFDAKHLYVFLRAYDTTPDSIMAQLSRRDLRTPSDYLGFMVDSYHDKRTGYMFHVNPLGVQRDIYVINDGEEDLSWDAVWFSATSRDAEGWTAEFRIPLSQLRYPDVENHQFGLMVMREIGRKQERQSWPVFRRSKTGFISQAGDVSGFGRLGAPRRIEINPYAVERNITRFDPSGRVTHPFQQQYGADVKIGVTSNLTLDASVNPDFGQVEADPAVLNLSAFEQFFAERRPFFVEGSGIFRFDTDCNDGQCNGLFYSRRIGRSPQLRGSFGDNTTPQFTPILAATKLTGRLGSGLSIGALNAYTPGVEGTQGRTVEPTSNYSVVRLQQDLRNGNSGIGMMLTSTQRRTDEWTADVLRREAYTGGIDARHRFFSNNYEIRGFLAGSRIAGSAAAIERTQRNAVHFYQRPGSPVALDPSRTSLEGYGARMSVGKTGGGITRWNFEVSRFSPGFDINDVGFLPRADLQTQSFWTGFRMLKPTKVYRILNLNVNQWSTFNTGGDRLNAGGNVNGFVQLPSFWGLFGGIGVENPLKGAVDDRVARGGPAVGRSMYVFRWLGLEGDGRKPIVPSMFSFLGRGDEGRSMSYDLNPSLQFRPSSRLQGSIGMGYSYNQDGWQWVGNYDSPTGTNYTFARLKQKTTSLTTRFDVTATRTLTMQIYAQPFITSGSFDDWRALSSTPAARTFADRFVPYGNGTNPDGFNFKQFRSNTVVRWEYRPGSALFVVWQHGRTQDGRNPGSFDFARDYRDLFRATPENTFLVKATYWFSL
ncbi:MAG: DUF5916 domain-containing protein [Gemmatimonadaceae bacterium]|nr:DUF5916 domain-containing protein [Gemmatimonadaceae bacterium]